MEYSINNWAVLVAAASYMVIGSLWYGPLFGKKWAKLAGVTPGKMENGMTAPKAMGLGFVGALLMSYVLAHFVGALGSWSASGAWDLTAWIWLGIAVPMTASAWLWEGKPFRLFVLNAANWLVSLFAATVILSYWR